MSPGEKRLTAHLLRLAGERFSNHGCNDFDLTKHCSDPLARDALVREYFEWNGTPEEYYEASEHGDDGRDWRLQDWMLMDFMADKLEAEADAA